MKVFLVQAATYLPEFDHAMPLGLMSLASYLRRENRADVRIFDMQLGVKTVEPVVEAAGAFRPDLIGVGGMTNDGKVIDALCRRLKEQLPSLPLVVGGPHGNAFQKEVMANEAVDFLIRGEGEVGLSALVRHLDRALPINQVPNLVRREDGALRFNPAAPFIENLDGLPFPDYDAIELEPYYRIKRLGFIYARRRYATIITSRGCPFRCIYCHNLHGRRYRARSAENVVHEMERLIEGHRIGEFIILDDLLNFDRARMSRIAERILERGLDISLSVPTGLRGDLITEEEIGLLRRAGMFRCMFAMDTGSPRLQALTRRRLNLERTLRAIEMARDQGIMVHGSFMIGFPTETEAEGRATIDLALRSKLHTAAFHRAMPFQGTEFYDMAVEAGVRFPEGEGFDWQKDSRVNASAMPDEALFKLRQEAYRRFYLSFSRLWGIFRTIPNRWRILPGLAGIWIRKAFIW